LSEANSAKVFVNKKNGNHYKILHEARDCTNSRDGARILVYCPINDNSQVFVRDEAEFYEKFIEVV
jgi:hypothetical protein